MIKTLLLILLTVTFRNASGQQNDIKELTTINQNWLNSYPKKDTATLSKIFAEDFVLASPNGQK
jgi:hypothetical protein